MPRISGVDIPGKKRIEIALTYIYGIGLTSSKKILAAAGVNGDLRADDVSDSDIAKIRSVIEASFKVEGDLAREIQMNIKRLKDLGAYRGLRHIRRLPCRGQRTNTNARTRKGRKRVAVAGKKTTTAPK